MRCTSHILQRSKVENHQRKHWVFREYPNQTVTLPLNVSLDLGSVRGAQHDLAMIDTDRFLVTCYSGSQGPTTLGHEISLARRGVTSRRNGGIARGFHMR